MPFGVVIGVGGNWGPGIGVLGRGPLPQGKGLGIFSLIHLSGVFEYILKQKCIRLVCENFKIFSFAKYITGHYVYSSFLRCNM